MLSQSAFQKIKEETYKFFKKMTLEPQIEISPPRDLTVPINLEVEDPQILIGEKGQILFGIQHLLKAILKREIQEEFYIDLDINDYKKKKVEYLKELARTTADEVAISKKEKMLPAMPSYERRIIHLELAERGDVSTQSIGREPERKVVVKVYP